MSAAMLEKFSNKILLISYLNRSSLRFIRYYSATADAKESKDVKARSRDEEDFRVYEIKGLKKSSYDMKRKQFKRRKPDVAPTRSLRMKPDQDWTKVWPTAATFKQSVVPLPLHQGYVEMSNENDGIPPDKYGNAELMKIPNFLHLTPAHIKKHCAAIKPFCSDWPEGLETDADCEKHFPIEVTASEYCKSAPSQRDFRARVIKIKFKLSILELDHHARDKFIRLVGDRYDRHTDTVTIQSDRCPLKQQNYEYCMYLLTALYHESWKIEPWELEKSSADMEQYYWDISQSRTTVVELVKTLKQLSLKQSESSEPSDGAVAVSPPGYLATVADDAEEETIVKLSAVQDYKSAVNALHNEGESQHTVTKYKQAVQKLLSLKENLS